MHLASIEREVDRAEHVLEISLRKEVDGAAGSLGAYGCVCLVIGIVVVTYCIEYRHIDSTYMSSDNLQRWSRVTVAFRISDITKTHTIARQSLLCNLGIDCRHTLATESVCIRHCLRVSLLIVGLRIGKCEECKFILHWLTFQGKIIDESAHIILLIEIRTSG